MNRIEDEYEVALALIAAIEAREYRDSARRYLFERVWLLS